MSRHPALHSGLRWGLALGGFLIAYGVVFRLLGLGYRSPWSWIFYLAVPVGGYLSLRRADRGGSTGAYRRAFATALLAATLGSALYAGYVYAHSRFVDDALLLEVREDLIDSAVATRPDAEPEQRRRIEAFTSPWLFSVGVFLRLAALGLVAAVVLAWRLGPAERPSG